MGCSGGPSSPRQPFPRYGLLGAALLASVSISSAAPDAAALPLETMNRLTKKKKKICLPNKLQLAALAQPPERVSSIRAVSPPCY